MRVHQTHLYILRQIVRAALKDSPMREIDADLAVEAGMDGNLRRLLQAARDLDVKAYEDDCEAYGEAYAEAGSSFVFGGGNPIDASLIAREAAGTPPRREDYGLSPIPAPKPQFDPDDDCPF